MKQCKMHPPHSGCCNSIECSFILSGSTVWETNINVPLFPGPLLCYKKMFSINLPIESWRAGWFLRLPRFFLRHHSKEWQIMMVLEKERESLG